MTRVGIVVEPLSLRRAIEAAIVAEPDIQVVSLLLGTGDSGLKGSDVLLVSVSPAASNVESLGRAWNAGRLPRLVLLDVGTPDSRGEPVALSEASRREMADAILAVRSASCAGAIRVAIRTATVLSDDVVSAGTESAALSAALVSAGVESEPGDFHGPRWN